MSCTRDGQRDDENNRPEVCGQDADLFAKDCLDEQGRKDSADTRRKNSERKLCRAEEKPHGCSEQQNRSETEGTEVMPQTTSYHLGHVGRPCDLNAESWAIKPTDNQLYLCNKLLGVPGGCEKDDVAGTAVLGD